MSKLKEIGEFIANVRKQKNITQEELAKFLKTTQSAVARIESGRQNVGTEMLYKISKALNKEIIPPPSASLNFEVEGGHKLSGSVTTNSSKNGAVFLLCATLLNKGKTILRDLPRIEEVNRIIEVLNSIGVKTKWLNEHDLEVAPSKIDLSKISIESAMKTRSAILMIGPLIHLMNKFSFPQPGGCKLGSRTINPHLYALEKMGINIETTDTAYEVSTKKLKPGDIVLYEMSDTATGNAIMAASKIKGATKLRFASSNYQVQELCNFLVKLGVRIDGLGTHNLTIYGRPEINETVEYHLSEDPIDAMLFLACAAVTNSNIKILRAPIDFLELELLKLEKMGFNHTISKRYKAKNEMTNLVDIETFHSKLIALPEKIHPMPYPGLNIDNLPFFVPIVAMAEGETLIHDWVYENRAIYYTELSKLGANVNLIDPHRIQINGPTKFKATEIICPPALRPAAIILIAMLAAPGKSVLRNIYTINRGYEKIHEKLNKLGAKIKLF